ncbi:MAG: methyltransferase domain-containing protein [Deltaproteobacteria bacterium]|nr:methyltransferase domain-containing protein [Deltaproteobacteria bacterium]
MAGGKLLNLGCGGRHDPAWVNLDLAPVGDGVLVHDVLTPLPFAAGEFAAVYHSHLLEHLPRDRAPWFLGECFRVLRPGGVLRVAAPDFEAMARLYLTNLDAALAGDEQAAQRYHWLCLEMFDQMVRHRSGGLMLDYWRRDPLPAEEFVVARMGAEFRNVRETLRGIPGAPPDPAPDPLEVGRFRLGGEVHLWMYDRFSLGRLLTEAGFNEVRRVGPAESAIPDFAAYQLDAGPGGRPHKPDSFYMEAHRPV